MRAAVASASDSEKCVGCGRSRSASSTSTSRSSSSGPRLVGDAVAVGQVGEAADAETENRTAAVPERNRLHFMAPEAERTENAKELELRQPSALRRRRIEHVAEHVTDVVERLRVAIARHRAALQRIEPPHVVHAEDVIGVTVREKDRVDAREPMGQRLRAEVGPGVDEDVRVGRLDQDGRPESRVVRIR